MFENIDTKTLIILTGIIITAFASYVIIKNMRPVKSQYEKEIEKILTSDQHKVKGKFE